MGGARRGSVISIAVLTATALPWAAIAQVQQNGTPETTSATSSSADATAILPTAGQPGLGGSTRSSNVTSSGASSRTAGKSAFGGIGKTQASTRVGTSGGSWTVGDARFGIKFQTGGIWRESDGGSMGRPGAAPTRVSAAEGLAPVALPELPSGTRTMAGVSFGMRSRTKITGRPSAGGRSSDGMHFGVSRGLHPQGAKFTGGKRPSFGSSGRPGFQSRSGKGRGSIGGASTSRRGASAFSTLKPLSSLSTSGLY